MTKKELELLGEVKDDIRKATGSFKYDFVFELILEKLNDAKIENN